MKRRQRTSNTCFVSKNYFTFLYYDIYMEYNINIATKHDEHNTKACITCDSELNIFTRIMFSSSIMYVFNAVFQCSFIIRCIIFCLAIGFNYQYQSMNVLAEEFNQSHPGQVDFLAVPTNNFNLQVRQDNVYL